MKASVPKGEYDKVVRSHHTLLTANPWTVCFPKGNTTILTILFVRLFLKKNEQAGELLIILKKMKVQIGQNTIEKKVVHTRHTFFVIESAHCYK